MNSFSVIQTLASRATRLVCAAAVFAACGGAFEFTAPAQGAVYNYITNCYDDPSEIAPPVCPNRNTGNAITRTVPAVDPCFIAQNAMRPCRPRLTGVDPQTVGRWTVQQKNGPWIWEIDRDGSYWFHSEAKDDVRTHQGTFASGKGRWSMKANSGFADSGTYRFEGNDTWIATGKWGTAAWHRDAAKASISKPVPPGPQLPGLRRR